MPLRHARVTARADADRIRPARRHVRGLRVRVAHPSLRTGVRPHRRRKCLGRRRGRGIRRPGLGCGERLRDGVRARARFPSRRSRRLRGRRSPALRSARSGGARGREGSAGPTPESFRPVPHPTGVDARRCGGRLARRAGADVRDAAGVPRRDAASRVSGQNGGASRVSAGPLATPLATGLRWLLRVETAVVLLAGVPLFVGSQQTDQYFAWTIRPPLTAAVLGALYWSAVPFVFLSAREREWAYARMAVPGVLVFTTLGLIATVLHADRFHFTSPVFVARAVAWAWLAIYVLVPPITAILLVSQLRRARGDPARSRPLPRLFTYIVAAQ